jgi:hypothetical protein
MPVPADLPVDPAGPEQERKSVALDDVVDTAPQTSAVTTAPSVATAPSADSELAPAFREAEWKSVYRHFQLVLVIAVALGIAAVAVGFAIGHPMGGAFVVIGLGLGTYNARRLWTDTTSLKGEVTDARKQMGVKSLRRLGLVTLLAVLFAIGWRNDDGWAVFLGLVIFQFLMMSMLIKPIKNAVRAL